MAKQTTTPKEKTAADKAVQVFEEVAVEKAATTEQAACEATKKATAEKDAHEAGEKAAAEEAAEKADREEAKKAITENAKIKNRLAKDGEQILAEYPEAREVYMTSNGFGFFRETDARNHAATLKDKTVTTIKRK